MLVDRWDRVQSVFLSLVDLPPEDQTRQLDAACGDDGEFRVEVESLLKSDRESAQTISSAIATEAALWSDTRTPIGDRLGAYRVVREIGRGGMGAVYLAIRDDDQFQKQVAIKVVKHGMDTEEVLGRFRHERQILANLDHPYIARLLDGGTTFDGRPFFVMDYVEGQALDLYAGARKIDIETRCRLFLRVLEAVAYAHRNLVVHRDLKPSNIFVTSDGSPKLLDFGVAKLLAADSGPGLTATSMARPFTPEYASPEQVLGLPAATTADIYSLGAVFYELLTGRRAQPIATPTPVEIERVVCRTEVERPSLLAPGLDSDLDNIVLMAMRKEPERRYQSADQFGEDIRRYLSGRAVLARQDSFWYRTRKFARRNRFQLSGAALIFASLVAALVVTLAQVRVAQSARRAAEAQRFNAEERLTQLLNIADKTLFDIHDAVARLPGATEARRVMVKTTLDYLEGIQRENGLDDRLRLTLGAGYSRIAAIQGDPLRPSLGDAAGALVSYRKAEVLLAPLYARRRDDAEVILHWLEVETGLADLAFIQTHSPQSVQMYLDLLPVSRRLAELDPSNLRAVKQEAEIEGALAFALQPSNSPASLDHAKRQIAVLTALTDRFPRDRDLKQNLGASLASAAVPLKDLGSYPDAAEYFERSIRTLEEFLEVEPRNAQTQRTLLGAYGDYCELLGVPWSANMGRSAEARSYCAKSVAMARELSLADPKDQTARFGLGFSLAELGMVDPGPNEVAVSLRDLEEALRILDPIVRANPSAAEIVLKVELVRQYAGLRLQRLGRLAEAADAFRQALAELEVMTQAKPGQPSGTAVTIGNEDGLAEVCAEQGDGEAALKYAAMALAKAQKYAASHPGQAPGTGLLGAAYFELAWVERTVGEWDRASADAERATSLWSSIGADHGVLSVHRQARERAEALVRDIAVHRAQ